MHAVHAIYPGHRLLTVAARVVLGVLVYAIAIVVVDRGARQIVRGLLARLRR